MNLYNGHRHDNLVVHELRELAMHQELDYFAETLSVMLIIITFITKLSFRVQHIGSGDYGGIHYLHCPI